MHSLKLILFSVVRFPVRCPQWQVVKEHTGLCDLGCCKCRKCSARNAFMLMGASVQFGRADWGGGAVFDRHFKIRPVFSVQEQFLVPDHTIKDISGASFAGFYYICFQKSAASIEGYYYHRSSEW